MLDDEISNILEKLDVDYLTTLELRSRFCEEPRDFEKERKLRLSAKERINERIKTLKKEAEIIMINYQVNYQRVKKFFLNY